MLPSANMFHEAQRRHLAGDIAGAAAIYSQLLKTHPRDPALLHQAGSAMMSLGRVAEAREHLLRAIRIKPSDPLYHYDLGLTYKRESRLNDARRAFQAGLRLRPDHPALRSALADLQATDGQWDAAYESLRPLAESPTPSAAVAQVFTRICTRLQRHVEAKAALHRALAGPALAPPVRAGLCFALAQTLEALGEYDDAFASVASANALRYSTFDPALHHQRIGQMIREWTAESIASMPKAVTTSRCPVFIVGMPRSGTSLIEQIIASHPKAAGAGELNDIPEAVHNLAGTPAGQVPLLTSPSLLTSTVVARISSSFLERLKRLAPRALRITDKMPLNCLHLGLIAAALPGASVIHCVRDPLDTCLSCYFQHFGGSNPFAYDLEHLGLFHREYQRLMSHWRGVLPLRMLDVEYERLVADVSGQTRRMLEFLELDWHDACLDFHRNKRIVQTASRDQVTQPAYQGSVGRHAHYARHLEPLRQALGLGG